ncbi:MAG TPA: diguanylate cyclase [Burkholderiaceae bacterium]|nr:diguanylate cyclase [Burkholderiaceae bacterium]HQR69132.1 diguanylate cyclase [Burkholderiaceae bacterium]
MKRGPEQQLNSESFGNEANARRATDQIDPHALIDRAERLLNTDPHDAVVFALRAQSVARARGAESLIARAHFVVGAALAQTGDWSGAIRQLSHAEHIYRAQNDVSAQCQVIMQLAAACSELGEYPEALDGFAQAERLARQHQDHAAVRRALVQTSSVHTALGDFSAARECLRSALELPSGTAADEGMVVLQFGLVDVNEGLKAALAGDAATVTRRMSEGEEHFDVALELLSGTTDRSTTIAARTQRGAARCWLGNFVGGLADLEEAVLEAARGGFRLREVQARLEQGYHLIAAGREADGIAVLRPAFLQAEELGDLRRLADMHERLSALYEARGDHQRALFHHKRFVEVKVRLDGKLSTQRARLHEARAELVKLRSQTAALHARAEHLEKSRTRLERLALEDELTGLANRRAFTKELENWCSRARAGQLRFGLVVADIDGFKQINDTYSHLTGDVVLRQLGSVIRGNLRDMDFAARLGGDEFALLLADSEGGAALTVIERILQAVRSMPWGQIGEGLTVTLSVGLCESADFGDSSELVRRADEALYGAKDGGRDRLNVWSADRA